MRFMRRLLLHRSPKPHTKIYQKQLTNAKYKLAKRCTNVRMCAKWKQTKMFRMKKFHHSFGNIKTQHEKNNNLFIHMKLKEIGLILSGGEMNHVK